MSKCMKNETDMPSEIFPGFTEEEEIHRPSTKTGLLFAHLLRVVHNLSSYTKITVFFHRTLLLNLIPQLWLTLQCLNNQILSNTIKTLVYSNTRIWKASHKKFTNHCSFSTKSYKWRTYNFTIVVQTMIIYLIFQL